MGTGELSLPKETRIFCFVDPIGLRVAAHLQVLALCHSPASCLEHTSEF